MGGMQVYLTGLADALARRGADITVFCDAAEDSESVDGRRAYPVVRFGGLRPWRQWRRANAIARALKRGHFEAVIADSWKSIEGLPRDASTTAGVLCLAHGAELLVPQASAKGRRIAASFARAGMVGANSNATAELVRPFLRKRTELRVIWPALDPPAGAPRSFARSPSGPGSRIISVARFDPYKGIDTVLQAIKQLEASHPEIVYDVVGDGADRGRLQALAQSLGIAERVRFHGRVTEQLKADLLMLADVFLLPNRSDAGEVEGFGLVFVEAGAWGLPAIAGADGGTRDAVVDGETGLLVDGTRVEPVAAAIARLLNDPESRLRMGRAGHERFWSLFAWDAAVARFEAALVATLTKSH
jgi:phosphatidylinositol alpha-1,6-mannosyltransferase